MITITSKFSTSSSEVVQWGPWDLVFHGEVIDTRGKIAVETLTSRSTRVHTIQYEQSSAQGNIFLDGNPLTRPRQQLVMEITDSQAKNICIEATTLGLLEITHLITTIFRAQWEGNLDILYAEPGQYRSSNQSQLREFDLGGEGIFSGVKDHNINLANHNEGLAVFFLGYEGARLNKALEQVGVGGWKKTAVFGVPAYEAGWETNAFVSNADPLSRADEYGAWDIEFCNASSVSAAFGLLVKLGDEQRREEQPMLIVPIGTKPHGIAAALYCCCYNSFDDNALTYDDPPRSRGRTEDVKAFHLYQIRYY